MNDSFANLLPVLLGTALIGGFTGTIGCYAVVRRQSLQGDAMAHAALPGIALAYLLGLRSSGWLIVAAAATAALSLLWVEQLVRKRAATFDAALASAIVIFFGAGVVLMTKLQRSAGGAYAARLPQYLFGQDVAVLTLADLIPMLALAAFALVLVLSFGKEFKLICFDIDYAQSLGWPVRGLLFLMTLATIAAVLAGLQSVGVILMSSLLVAPGVAARQYTSHFGKMQLLALAHGAAAGVVGTYTAHTLSERGQTIPTGPTIVLVATLFAFFSLLFAPHRGFIPTNLRKLKFNRQVPT